LRGVTLNKVYRVNKVKLNSTHCKGRSSVCSVRRSSVQFSSCVINEPLVSFNYCSPLSAIHSTGVFHIYHHHHYLRLIKVVKTQLIQYQEERNK